MLAVMMVGMLDVDLTRWVIIVGYLVITIWAIWTAYWSPEGAVVRRIILFVVAASGLWGSFYFWLALAPRDLEIATMWSRVNNLATIAAFALIIQTVNYRRS